MIKEGVCVSRFNGKPLTSASFIALGEQHSGGWLLVFYFMNSSS